MRAVPLELVEPKPVVTPRGLHLIEEDLADFDERAEQAAEDVLRWLRYWS